MAAGGAGNVFCCCIYNGDIWPAHGTGLRVRLLLWEPVGFIALESKNRKLRLNTRNVLWKICLYYTGHRVTGFVVDLPPDDDRAPVWANICGPFLESQHRLFRCPLDPFARPGYRGIRAGTTHDARCAPVYHFVRRSKLCTIPVRALRIP